jgi:hypothetical protein
MKGNSNRPKGVVMAIFWMSLGWTGIWLYARTESILEKKQQPESSHGCDGQDSGLEWYERSALYSLRRDTNRCPSLARTKNSRSGKLCHLTT